MNNRKLGIIFFMISIAISAILISMISSLNNQAKDIGCFENKDCVAVGSSLSITHFAFGFIGFILALGFYLILFSKSEEAILKELKDAKETSLKAEKFDLVMKGLDSYEKKALTAIREQDGITQNTLRIRTDMSKAKLSYILYGLENKGLVKKIKKGKTFAVFLRESF